MAKLWQSCGKVKDEKVYIQSVSSFTIKAEEVLERMRKSKNIFYKIKMNKLILVIK